MNRSILIVICDFLLLSLLTFSTDINRMADEDTSRSAKTDVVTNIVVDPGRDLAAAMKMALAEEQTNRWRLQEQLEQARGVASEQQSQLAQREQENSKLQEQFNVAQSNLAGITREMLTNSAQAQAAQEKLTQAQSEEQKQSELAAALQKQLDQLSRSNQMELTEKQRLANQLQLAEAERRAAADRAAIMQQEVAATRSENEKLAQGFQALATNSSQLTKEIRENRALAPNAIFSEFVSNRVDANFLAVRPTFLGFGGDKQKSAKIILASDGKNIFAIGHVQSTPLTLWDPGTDWDKLTGTLAGHAGQIAINSISFDATDPRVVFFPVSADGARQLGNKVYATAADPYKFQDAVLIGADEGYYGECNFQIDLSTPNYLKLDRSVLRGLFGKFNPSRGDFVFSRTGELLGIMVNNDFCLALQNFSASATLPFETDLRARHTGEIFQELYARVFQMPLRLQ